MKTEAKLKAGIIGFALSFFLLLQLLANYPEFVEKYYSNGIYPVLTQSITGFAREFPFAITELAFWVFVVLGLHIFIGHIRKKKSVRKLVLNFLIVASFLYIWFYLFWGINYFRQPLKKKLDLQQVALPVDAFDSTLVSMIHKSNTLNISYTMKEPAELNRLVEASYQTTLNDLGLPIIPGYQGLKTLLGNWVLNKTITTGFFSPFFHEVFYNKDMLIFEIPFVMAHEKAHQMGYASEAEANFLAYLVCTGSDDPLLRYSGYMSVLGYFLQDADRDSVRGPTFRGMLSQGVKLDRIAVQQNWESHRGVISRLSRISYDVYLRTNQVPDGIRSYSRVVDLIVRYRIKSNGSSNN